MVLAYLDDITVRVPAHLAAQAITLATECLTSLGGTLNPTKARVWVANGNEPAGLPDGTWSSAGLLLLGTPHDVGPEAGQDVPVGTGSKVEEVLKDALDNYASLLEGLRRIIKDAPDTSARLQTALYLMRTCALGKLTHLLRALPPSRSSRFAQKADRLTEKFLRDVCNLPDLSSG